MRETLAGAVAKRLVPRSVGSRKVAAMVVTTKDFCAQCLIDKKLTPSIAWEGAPICREHIADIMAKREPQPFAGPTPGLPAAVATLQ